MNRFTVQKIIGNYDLDPVTVGFIRKASFDVDQKLDLGLRWWAFPIEKFAREQQLWVCYDGSEPIGFMAATLQPSFLDSEHIVLYQHFLYAKPGSRASVLLMKEFIDFGKRHANSIITVISKSTNIKPESLSRLGFTELETLYKLEV